MSKLIVANLEGTSASNKVITVASPNSLYAQGHVIQVVNKYQTTDYTVSVPSVYNTYTDLTGLNAVITPKSASSSIYMFVRWFGEYNPVASMGWNTMFNVKRNGSLIGQPPQPGALTIGIAMASLSYYANDNDSTPEMAFFDYYDSPATTSQLTYQVCVSCNSGGTMYVNRCVNAATTGGYERGTTSITLMEIAG